MLSTKFRKIFALVLVLAVAINTFTLSAPVSAESDAPVMKWTLRDRAASYYYFNSLKSCVHKHSNDLSSTGDPVTQRAESTKFPSIRDVGVISDKDAKSGDWWVKGTSYTLGDAFGGATTAPTWLDKAIPDSENGFAKCNAVVKRAAKLWKTTPLKMLCSMGTPKRSYDQDCESGSKIFHKNFSDEGIEKLKTFITNTHYKESKGKVVDMITAMGNEAGSYAMLYAALTDGCGYSISDSAKAGSSNVLTGVKVVDLESGNVSTHTFAGSKDKDTEMYPYSDGSNSGVKMTCAGIAQAMIKWGDAASKFIKNYNESYRKSNQNNKDKKDGSAAAGSEKPDANYCQENPDSVSCSNNAPTQDEGTSTCPESVGAIGWIVCPAVNFMGKLTDALYGIINNFLFVKPELLKTPGATSVWTSFRNIANILLVFAFLFIIYSQMTGLGLSNYGVKSMLPKLIMVTILINISLYISQVMVDLSNILGGSLYGLINTLGGSKEYSPGVSDFFGTVVNAGITIGTVAAVAGLASLAEFSLLIILLVGAVIGLLITFLILIGRNAFIVILALVAPLAFVSLLLPNTEKFFKKWWDMFLGLLVVYPMIAVVFGLSKVAAHVFSTLGDPVSQFVAIGASTLPMLSSTILLQGAMAATGTIGAFAKGAAGTFNAMAKSGAKRSLFDGAQETKLGYGIARANERRKRQKKLRQSKDYAKATGLHANLFDTLGGKGNAEERETLAGELEEKEYEEDISRIMAYQKRYDRSQLKTMLMTGKNFDGSTMTAKQVVAAQRKLIPTMDAPEVADLIRVTPGIASQFSEKERKMVMKESGSALLENGWGKMVGTSALGGYTEGKVEDGAQFLTESILTRAGKGSGVSSYKPDVVLSDPKLGSVINSIVSQDGGGWSHSDFAGFQQDVSSYLSGPEGHRVTAEAKQKLGGSSGALHAYQQSQDALAAAEADKARQDAKRSAEEAKAREEEAAANARKTAQAVSDGIIDGLARAEQNRINQQLQQPFKVRGNRPNRSFRR